MRQVFVALAFGLLATIAAPGSAQAQQVATPAAATASDPKACGAGVGCVSRRPLPRYVSLKGSKARARRGPGQDHRVDWVYQRPGLPLKITAEYENWRRVEDPEGVGGWMHYALLSPSRTAMVLEDMAELRASPDPAAAAIARAEAGAIVRLLACEPGWCRLSRDGLRGWMPKTALWGVAPDETFD